ncbi:jg22490 [Pararge aegeria aegeria]|uniref:Jg22490 protein n=1 Tax=Pararge aegeria aegeria TaxID=348720 RepID=A0A8S4RB33_9NEOP|nr:jg22490 [Pararge aegeria aegeria]
MMGIMGTMSRASASNKYKFNIFRSLLFQVALSKHLKRQACLFLVSFPPIQQADSTGKKSSVAVTSNLLWPWELSSGPYESSASQKAMESYMLGAYLFDPVRNEETRKRTRATDIAQRVKKLLQWAGHITGGTKGSCVPKF